MSKLRQVKEDQERIGRLELALTFYAGKENYATPHSTNDPAPGAEDPSILRDMGKTARRALEPVQ